MRTNNIVMRFRITEADASRLQAAARLKGLTLSAWIRSELLERVAAMEGQKALETHR